MTVPTEIARSPVYEGDGTNNLWPFNFRVIAASDITLFRRLVGGEEVAITTGFTVAGVGQQAGGTVTYPTTGARLQAGEKLVVVRRPPFLQLLALTQDVNLFRDQIENQLDRDVFMAQALRDQIGRSLQLQQTSPLPQLYVPPASPGAAIGWNADGTGLVNLPGVGGGSGGSTNELPSQTHGLLLDGTNQSAEFKALLAQAVEESWSEVHIVGDADGTSMLLLDDPISLDEVPPLVKLSRVHVLLGKRARIFIRGRQVELPLVGKAKLAADVDVSGGTVASFDVDLSANEAELLPLLTTDADVVVRGQNGLDGDALEGHKLEDSVVSLVPVSGTIYTLTLARGLTGSVGPTWYRVWAGSEHLTQPDETLISIPASARLVADATDSAVVQIAEGKAAALGLAPGDWLEVTDDTTGADTAGTSAELVHRQLARIDNITASAGNPDTITFEAQIDGALMVARRARIIKVTPAPRCRLVGPGPAYPVTRLGVPDPYPASRVHAIQTEYCIAPEVTNWAFKRELPTAFARGAAYRDTLSWKPHFHHNRIERAGADIAEVYTGGDLYGVWIKGSFEPVVEYNEVSGGRHCIVFANTTGGTMRWNDMSGAAFQLGDVHGEGETRVAIYGNVFRRGEAWAGRSSRVAFQIGNQTHLYGARRVRVHGNFYRGFTGAEDVAVRVVSGAREITIDENFTDPVATAVQITADRRSPTVPIANIVVKGTVGAVAVAVAIDGRMPAWAASTEFEGTASRQTYCETTEGSVWSTPDIGTSSTVEPTMGETPEVDVTTFADGDITWTLRAISPYSPIHGVVLDGVKIDAATTPVIARRVSDLHIRDSFVRADEGMRFHDAPGFRVQNLTARIGAGAADPWLIDEGGNDLSEYRLVDANGGGIDDAGGSEIVDATPVGAGGGAAGLTALVRIDRSVTEAGAVSRDWRDVSSTPALGQITIINLALAVAGRVDISNTSVPGDRFTFFRVPGSAAPTIDFEGDTGGDLATFGSESARPVIPAPSGTVTVHHVSTNGETGIRYFEIDGPLIGNPSYVHGDLVAVEPGGSDQRSTLAGFNTLANVGTQQTASFNFTATMAGQVVPMSHASTPVVGTIPSNASEPLPIGTIYAGMRTGDAAASLAIATDTLRPMDGRTLAARAKYSLFGAVKIATTEWVAFGDFAES